MIVIELLHPQEERVLKTWKFDRTRSSISVGRCESNDITLPSNLVSRQHLEFNKVGDDWKVENLGKNGCYINGQKVNAALLRHSSKGAFWVQIGKVGPCLRVKIGNPLLADNPVVPQPRKSKIYVSQSIREYAARRKLTLTDDRTLTETSETAAETPTDRKNPASQADRADVRS